MPDTDTAPETSSTPGEAPADPSTASAPTPAPNAPTAFSADDAPQASAPDAVPGDSAPSLPAGPRTVTLLTNGTFKAPITGLWEPIEFTKDKPATVSEVLATYLHDRHGAAFAFQPPIQVLKS